MIMAEVLAWERMGRSFVRCRLIWKDISFESTAYARLREDGSLSCSERSGSMARLGAGWGAARS
jgi:hypothetical protein